MSSTQFQDLVLHPENLTESSPADSDFSSSVQLKQEENLTQAPGVTKVIQKPLFNRRKYRNITDSMRKKLIEAVQNQGEKIKHAAKKFNINYSSAKSICQVFKREGRANKKAFKTRANPFNENAKSGMNLKAKGSLVRTKASSLLLSSVKLSPGHTTNDSSLQTKASPVMTTPGSDHESFLKSFQAENSMTLLQEKMHDSMIQDRLNKINQINNLLSQAQAQAHANVFSSNKIQQIMAPSVVVNNPKQLFGQNNFNNIIFAGVGAPQNNHVQGFNMSQNMIGNLNNMSIDNSRYRIIPISTTLPQTNMNMNQVLFNIQQQQQQQQQQPIKYALIQAQQPMPQMIRVYPQQINNNLYQGPLNYY